MLGKIVKVLGYLLLVIVIVVLGALAVFFMRYPKVEAPPQIHVVSSPERIAHGEYLAKHVVGCVYCHATRNPHAYSDPVVPGTEGRGGLFLNVPGATIYAPNITPHALSSWSDGEIARSITSGVNKQGHALFPIMPYPNFALMTEEDLTSVIVYIRSLPPIDYDPPRTKLGFPLNLIVRTMPQPVTTRRDPVTNRGFYLTRLAGCNECHTPKDSNHKPLPGMDFAGGEKFENGAQSANITPDAETGIGKWSKENFISQFKRFDSAAARNILLADGTQNTPMPWTTFAGMKEEDLSAIYDYLRTIPAVRHVVQRFHPAIKQ